MEILRVVSNQFLSKPINDSDDRCNFCGDPDSGRHCIWLPVRYQERIICDNCAAGYAVITDCCGYIGE